MFGSGGFKITHPGPDGKMPWSPTVVHVNRMKAKRAKRSLWLIMGVCMAILFSCGACYATVNKPKIASAAKVVPTATATRHTLAVATPRPGWTPYPGTSLQYQIVPFTPTPR